MLFPWWTRAASKPYELLPRALAKTPLMITIDGTNGAWDAIGYVLKFPYQLTLGAMNDDSS